MKQKQIAKKLGISVPMVSMVLNGERRLSINNAKSAGQCFMCDPAVFLFGTTEEIREALNYKKEKGEKENGITSGGNKAA